MAGSVKQPPKATPKQVEVVKAKIRSVLENIPQGVVAQDVFPGVTPQSASVMMSRELKSVNVQDLLNQALEKHDLTPNAVVRVVSAGMKARKIVGEKQVYDDEGNVVAVRDKTATDHGIRLKAAGMAAQFMGIGKNTVEGGVHFHNHVAEKKDGYSF